MNAKIRSVAAVAAVMFAAAATTATAGWGQNYDPQYIGYRYDYYSDAAKTQLAGTVYDYGCGGEGEWVYVVRVNVPSAYFEATPTFYCGNGQIEPILV